MTTTHQHQPRSSRPLAAVRTRWAAFGAAVAVSIGAGGIGLVQATETVGDAAYTPIEPCRLLDTRPGHAIGGRATPLGPGEVLPVKAHGEAGQCAGRLDGVFSALQLNVTALQATEQTHLTVWSGEEAMPNASSVNPAPGQPPIPNAVTVEVEDGWFEIYNHAGNVHVIVDVVGKFSGHHHDSVYYRKHEVYTKSEVNERVTDTMWVRVAANGDRLRGSSGTSSLLFPPLPIGRYVVTFPNSVEECGLLVSNNSTSGDVATMTVRPFETTPSPNDAYVYVENEAGLPDNHPFSIQVTCPSGEMGVQAG